MAVVVPTTAFSEVGAEGTVKGVRVNDMPPKEDPVEFKVYTKNVYVVPFVRFEIVAEVVTFPEPSYNNIYVIAV